jgi:hypothetical protein
VISLTPTITLLELLWTTVALVGIGFSGFALRDALTDRRALKLVPDASTGDELIVNTAVRNERYRFILFCGFSVVGTTALFLVNAPPTLGGTIIGLILLGLEVGGLWNTWQDRIARHKLLRGESSTLGKEG